MGNVREIYEHDQQCQNLNIYPGLRSVVRFAGDLLSISSSVIFFSLEPRSFYWHILFYSRLWKMVITVGDVVNATWSPPPAAWLNFTNCSAAAAWLAAYGQLYEDEGSLWDGVSFDIVIGYLGSMIPRNWTKPTDANLLVWYHEKNYFRDNNALLMDMINFPLSKCSAQVCPKLQWEGDPDLTGVGVSTA